MTASLPRLLLALPTVLLAGCGSGDYHQKTTATLKRVQAESPFLALWPDPVKDFRGQDLSLRIPKYFQAGGATVLEPTAEVSEEKKVEPTSDASLYRVRPHYLSSVFKAPDLQRTYEAFVEMPSPNNPSAKVRRSLYLYVVFMQRKYTQGKFETGKDIEKQLRDLLVRQFEKDKKDEKRVTEWEEVAVPTPDGQARNWKRIKAKGEQWHTSLEGETPSLVSPINYQGLTMLFLRSTDDFHVILGWRSGVDVAEALKLDEVATACAGTVTVGGK